MRGRWWWQKSGRPTGGARGGACRAGTNQAQRATRLWADGDAPRELALPAEGAERSRIACRAAGAGRRAPAIWLPAAVYFPAAGEDRERGAAVAGESQAGVPAVPRGRAGHAAQETPAIAGRSAGATGGTAIGERSVDYGLHAR